MKTRWQHLSLAEKKVVVIGSAVIIPLLIYALVFSPLSNSVQTLRDQVQKNQRLLAWMQQNDEKIRALEKVQHPASEEKSSTALLSLIQNALNQSTIGKNISQLQQAEGNAIQIKFQQVNFDSLMQWLIPFCQARQLVITQMTIKPMTATGTVDAELKLQAG